MKKKRGMFFFVLLLMLVNLSSCSGGSYTITIGEIETSQNEIVGEYNSFSGHYFKKVELDVKEKMTVNFSAKTEEGELIAKVIDSEGKTIKTMNAGAAVTVKEPGDYKLQVEGRKHKGSFTLSWDFSNN